MTTLSHTTSNITTETYEIDLGGGRGKVTYIEYLNDSGKVIDEILRSEAGHEIDDPALLEEVQEFVDAQA